MSLATTLTDLTAHFKTQWGTTTPIAYPNVDFNMSQYQEFVVFDVSFGGEKQTSLGDPTSNRYRQRGIVAVKIFTSLNRGAKRAMQLADLVSTIFRTKNISGIVMYAPSTTVVGQADGSYQVNVSISFYVDDYH